MAETAEQKQRVEALATKLTDTSLKLLKGEIKSENELIAEIKEHFSPNEMATVVAAQITKAISDSPVGGLLALLKKLQG